MAVVAKGYGNAEAVAQHCGEGDDTLPRHVRRVFHTSRLEVSAWCADAHGTNLKEASVVLCQLHDALCQGGDIVADIWVFFRPEGSAGNDVSTNVNNSKCGLVKTDVNTNYPVFYSFSFHVSLLIVRR